MGDATPKGYALEDLLDAFARYLPGPQQAQQAPQVERPQAGEPGVVAVVADVAASGEGEGMVLPFDVDEELARVRAKFSEHAAA